MTRSYLARPPVAILIAAALVLQPPVYARAASPTAAARWLRVDPHSANTLYVGVAGPFLTRSTDGGTTWEYLRDGAVLGPYADLCGDAAEPPVVASDSSDLYVSYQESTDPACRSGSPGLLRSRDGGRSFASLSGDTLVSLATPIASHILYAILSRISTNYMDQWPCSNNVYARNSGDTAWRRRGTVPAGAADPYEGTANPLSGDRFCPDLIDDPHQPGLVYANTVPPVRSVDGGLTWTAVITPTAMPALATFALRIDPAAPGVLEGVTDTKGVPKDRVYFSWDQGRTWTAGGCSGGHAGACPGIVLQNVFGDGSRYAVYGDGIYAFDGTSPASRRLPLGDGWPFGLAQVAGMQAGTRAGDPVYALLTSGAIYRSPDVGQSWMALTTATLLPTAKPAAPPPHALPAGPYGYAVDPHFIAMFRRWGSAIVGFPVDVPYRLQGDITQDFEHLSLVWRAGRAVVGTLGQESGEGIYCGIGSDDPLGFCANGLHGPGPGGALQEHAADFATFVAQHGGVAIFGSPLSRVYQATNDDGSKRTYAMQLFTGARLEWHPESSNIRYRVLLGLLGREVLRGRQWR